MPTMFGTSLDDFFAGKASLQELETVAGQIAAGQNSVTDALQELESALATGRLPVQIYRALKVRLTTDESLAPEAADDATLLVSAGSEVTDRTRIAPQSAHVEAASPEGKPPPEQSVDKTILVAREARNESSVSSADPTLVVDHGAAAGAERSSSSETQHASKQSKPTGSNWANPELWSKQDTSPIGQGSEIGDGRFVLEQLLGRGGMGVVYKALDRNREVADDSDPYVAIKILNKEFKDHPKALVALQRETRKAQTLAHPNIVTVYDFDRDGSTVYMTMELMRGQSLSQFIQKFKHGGASRDTALPIIFGMAEALAYAHKRRIVHSDFKPGNVYVTSDDRVKLLDFGIARSYDFGEESTEDTFDAGELGALTPGYASLEMFLGEPPHPADDVYALAVTAYQLFSGEHPFQRRTAKEAHAAGLKPQPLKGVRRREWTAIRKGLMLERAHRLQDGAEFLKIFRGATAVRKSLYAALAVSSLLVVFFGYRSTLDLPGPFPEERRTEFEQSMSFGAEAYEIADGDASSLVVAAAEFAVAYDIHPKNPEAVGWLRQIADDLLDVAAPDDRYSTVANLVCKGNLSSYRPVTRACAGLGTEVCENLISDCQLSD